MDAGKTFDPHSFVFRLISLQKDIRIDRYRMATNPMAEVGQGLSQIRR